MGKVMRNVIFITRFRTRLKGLLFTKPHKSWLVFSPCKGVHTFGMRYTIDIAFLSREGIVLESFRGVGPRRALRNRRAVIVIERFESEESWLKRGDKVNLRISGSMQCEKENDFK